MGGASLPVGWAVCDGTKGTPDLRGVFLRGARGGRPVGSTGGASPSSEYLVGGIVNDRADRTGTGFKADGTLVGGTATVPVPPYYSVVYIMKK